jgi:hypothetical protein
VSVAGISGVGSVAGITCLKRISKTTGLYLIDSVANSSRIHRQTVLIVTQCLS